MSTFNEDLGKEEILGKFLDRVYTKLNIPLARITDADMQHQGIDLIYTAKNVAIHIDEKAQLHYLNKDLPTFTFELSYLKDSSLNQGWLLDPHKKTDFFFLITGIFLKNETLSCPDDIDRCKITSVNRKKLIAHLSDLGLTDAKLTAYDTELRKNNVFGRHPIKELDKKNGLLFFTEHLAEKPINLQLRLQYLLDNKIGKRIYPID